MRVAFFEGDPKCKSWSDCVAKDAECYNCEKIGHFAKVCFFGKKGRPPEAKKGQRRGARDRSLTPGPYARSRCVKVSPDP